MAESREIHLTDKETAQLLEGNCQGARRFRVGIRVDLKMRCGGVRPDQAFARRRKGERTQNGVKYSRPHEYRIPKHHNAMIKSKERAHASLSHRILDR